MMFVTPILVAALCGALTHLIARVWRPDQLFFVQLGRELTPADRRRSRRAVAIGWLGSAGSVAVALASPGPAGAAASAALITVAVGWPLVELLLLLPTLDRPELPGRIRIDLGPRPGPTALMSMPLAALELGLLAVAVLLFVTLWPALPDQVPLHFAMDGTPDRYGSPVELVLFGGLVLFDIGLAWVIAYTVSSERAALPEESAERFAELQQARRYGLVRMTQTLLFGVNVGLLTMAVGIAASVVADPLLSTGLAVGVGLAVVAVGIIAPLVYWLPRMTALRSALDALGAAEIGTRREGWKLGGLFYYAPDDPALFVPKRVGIGQTLNMGRGAAWAVIVLLVGLPLAFVGLMSLLG